MTSARRSGVLLLLVAGLGVAAAGCGSSAEDDYASGWNGVCRDVDDAYRAFRTDVVSAAKSSRDDGDAAAARPLPPTAVSADLARPVRKLERALQGPLADARGLDPPSRWSSWNRTALRRFAAQGAIAIAGARQVEAGDADALSALALGGFGPAADDAPGALRDQTPDCTGLR